MGERKIPESLEVLMEEKQKAEAEFTYWTHKEEILRHQMNSLEALLKGSASIFTIVEFQY